MAQHPDELIHVMEDLASRGDRVAAIWLLENVHGYGSKYGKRNSKGTLEPGENALSGPEKWMYQLACDGWLPFPDTVYGRKQRDAGVIRNVLLGRIASEYLDGDYTPIQIIRWLRRDRWARSVAVTRVRNGNQVQRCTRLCPLPEIRDRLLSLGAEKKWHDDDAKWTWRVF